MKRCIVLLLVVISLFLAGCTSSSSSFKPIDETINIPYDYVQPYELSGEKGATFDISIKTDGSPVDILIFDSENYLEYDKAFETGSGGKWKSVMYRDIVSKSFSYTLPEIGSYWLVIENSEFTSNGADAKRSVNVTVKIE